MHNIFSTYSQGENRVTSTIIQVLRNLPINVVEQFLGMFSELGTQSFILFKNQVGGGDSRSVPDAEISAKFRLLFEAKIFPNRVDLTQLTEHMKEAEKDDAELIYLTPDISKPELLSENGVNWKSFHDVYALIDELLKSSDLILSERDQFLLRNLQEFISESGLLPVVDEVVIVAASTAWPVYQETGIYVCQAGRSFRKTHMIGFYANGQIQPKIARIILRETNFQFPNGKETAFAMEVEPRLRNKIIMWLNGNEWAYGKTLQLFDLSEPDSEDTITLRNCIVNDLQNTTGRRYAYTQGQRYAPLSRLEKSEYTSDLI